MSQDLIQKYIEQSEHNEMFLQKILDYSEYVDWSVTVTFYFAVHRFQAALLKDHNLRPDKHEHPDWRRSRNKLVQMLYSQHWKLYYFLYHESQKARYVPSYHRRMKLDVIQERIREALNRFKKLP